MTADNATAYAAGRARISALVKELDADRASRVVPHCPEWTVRETVAHLTGICSDIIAGNLEGVASDPWTAAQVNARRGRSVQDIVREWSDVGPRIEEMLPSFPPAPAAQLVFDLTTHEHDLRNALGAPGARDSDGVRIGTDFGVRGVLAEVSRRGLATMRVTSGAEQWTSGEGEATATLDAEPFDLFRSVAGRRSANQLRTLRWSADPEPYIPAFEFGPFKLPAQDVRE